MKKTIAVLAGDGIGPEVMSQAIRVLTQIAKLFNHQFILQEADIGGAAFEKYQQHFPNETKILCENVDAILFGSVGGPIHEANLPKWQDCEKNSILALRKTLKLNANIRPIIIYPQLEKISPLKETLINQGINMLIVRELTGDIYFGEHQQFEKNGTRCASDVANYDEHQIASVVHRAFQLARDRKKKLTLVDKANVLEISKLWRNVTHEIAAQYPEIKCETLLVDNCAMQLVLNPKQFDVIVTSNLFGDILSDLAAALSGSLGLMPSASLNNEGFGLYEPAGGSAPDIAGKNIANPIAQILSVAMMLKHSFALNEEANMIEQAILTTLNANIRTRDLYQENTHLVTTQGFTDALLELLTFS